MRAYGIPGQPYETPPFTKLSRAREKRVTNTLLAEQLADEREWWCDECKTWGRCPSAKPSEP